MARQLSALEGHSGAGTVRKRAAQYVRMSTDHQQYSTENQSDSIQQYAREHGFDIVRTYADDGKSGLSISGRDSLARLIDDVQGKAADFEAILVYDVSRWGRFQDSDESAYYEYLCRRAGITVHYCAEQFANDGSLSSTLLKTIKRTMAGEYSRELSVKVFAGQCRLIELGFRQGGPPGYGLRRLLVDQNRSPKGLLARGERKSLQTDRVVLVPGPAEEVALVREIYWRFTEELQSQQQIADALNARGLTTDFGRPWTRASVQQVLTNPKYVGANVYNRRSFKLKKKRVVNPPDRWIFRDQAFEALIDVPVFERAQQIIAEHHHRFTDEEMLQMLRRLLEEKGTLSGILIEEANGMPSSSAYRNRFKSLTRAYRLIGFSPGRDISYIEINRLIRAQYKQRLQELISEITATGATVRLDPSSQMLAINEEFTLSVIFARCRKIGPEHFRWLVRLDTSLVPDITVAVRLQPDNQTLLDYYLLPAIDSLADRIRLHPENGFLLDVYRFENLSFLVELCRRYQVEDAA